MFVVSQSRDMQIGVRLIGDFKLTVGVNISVSLLTNLSWD